MSADSGVDRVFGGGFVTDAAPEPKPLGGGFLSGASVVEPVVDEPDADLGEQLAMWQTVAHELEHGLRTVRLWVRELAEVKGGAGAVEALSDPPEDVQHALDLIDRYGLAVGTASEVRIVEQMDGPTNGG